MKTTLHGSIFENMVARPTFVQEVVDLWQRK